MVRYSAIVLGGGLSGLAAAYALARGGVKPIVVLERGDELGGLAGSFEHEGRSYPLGYHHILHRDRTLLLFLQRIGALSRVRWRRIRMLFETPEGLFDLSRPIDFVRYPMPWADKLRFARLMLRAYAKSDWSDWHEASAAELIDRWGSPVVREHIFEPLCRLKFELSSDEVSAAWLGARLHFREGAAPLGYIPGTNWTKVLCDGLADLVHDAGVETRTRSDIERLHTSDGRVVEVALANGDRLAGDIFLSSVPTVTYLKFIERDWTSQLSSIRYTALISAVCGVSDIELPDFYWTNLSSCQSTACAIFRLDALNPTLADRGTMCLNFVTHLSSRDRPLFRASDAVIVGRYLEDFRRVFRTELRPSWIHVSRVPMYSPVFDCGYANPPVRSATWDNVYFAGNYRTFPSVASTGTALASGLETAAAILQDQVRRPSLRPVSAPAA